MKKIFLLLFSTIAMQSQTVTYSESFENFANPERGFYRPENTRGSSDPTGTYVLLNQTTLNNYRLNDKITLIQRNFRLNDFINSNTIPDWFIQNMKTDFARMRLAGIKCIVRFSYSNFYPDAFGNYDPLNIYEPTKSIILSHINILMPILNQNLDVISSVEAGFIGNSGEWNRSTNFGEGTAIVLDNLINNQFKTDRYDIGRAILNGLSSTKMVAFRTVYFQKLISGTKIGNNVTSNPNPITSSIAYNGSILSRIAAHNDCFLANATDSGTFENSNDPTYLETQSKYNFEGGETCMVNNISPDFYSGGSNALDKMKKYHYNNLNIVYKEEVINNWNTTFMPIPNNTRTYLEEMKMKLGYRFTLNNSSIFDQSNRRYLKVTLSNVGFANIFNKRKAYFVFRDIVYNKEYIREITETNVNLWNSGNNVTNFTIELPIFTADVLPPGPYKLFLYIPDPTRRTNVDPKTSVRLANTFNNIDIWEPSTGYNNLNIIYTPINSQARIKDSLSKVFEVTNYPNPFNDTFKFNVSTSSNEILSIKIYDMLGKLIENNITSISDINNLEIGKNYSKGIYNIVVTQGENIKTLRVIKN